MIVTPPTTVVSMNLTLALLILSGLGHVAGVAGLVRHGRRRESIGATTADAQAGDTWAMALDAARNTVCGPRSASDPERPPASVVLADAGRLWRAARDRDWPTLTSLAQAVADTYSRNPEAPE